MTKTIILTIITMAIIIYIVIGTILVYKQRTFLYFPKGNTEHKEKDIFLKNGDCTLQIIVVNEGKSDAIIYFGGNAETISNSTDYMLKQFPNNTSYMMNYRGYGLSNCSPTEKGIYSDSLVLYDYVNKEHNKISVGGRSLGSGVATYLASKRKVHRLVLITPYDSILSIAKKRFPIYPIEYLLEDTYKSGENVKHFKTKTLLAIAEKDTLITMENTKKLIDRFPKDQVSLLIIKEANHINISQSEEYFNKVRDFVIK